MDCLVEHNEQANVELYLYINYSVGGETGSGLNAKFFLVKIADFDPSINPTIHNNNNNINNILIMIIIVMLILILLIIY